MSSTSVFCPHCENHVDIQVAAVTRTRACPKCGEVLVLQVAGASRASKRKALLVASTPPVDEALKEEPLTNGFEGLPEDPFDRMRLDPSLRAVRRNFFMGVGGVVSLMIAATISHYSGGEPQDSQPLPGPAVTKSVPLEEQSFQRVSPAFATLSLEERLDRMKAGDGAEAEKKPDMLNPPVYELSSELSSTTSGSGAPRVFEVQDQPVGVAPAP